MSDITADSIKSRRPAPFIDDDNHFFWSGLRSGKLLIQQCTNCGTLRHPPSPSCRSCHCLEWVTVASSGHGRIHSYVAVHHPQLPGLKYPNVAALVELEEGIRVVGEFISDADDAKIDLPVAISFIDEGEHTFIGFKSLRLS